MVQHGTRSCYVKGCRQPECVEAHRVYQASIRDRRRNGDASDRRKSRPELVDATPARTHLNKLTASGYTLREIVEVLDGTVSHYTIGRISRGYLTRITSRVSEAILELTEVDDDV